ncbi:hypothetical protein [Mucilaginibacter xinganensis]|uniref:Uncharacterized protein n=1 Tax=Mucilaginibacter xinganensis TaxID=1234841 RepID=A0A223NR83_9SPHI|nr:hypothetical protein [Mucilaginibacter xinganensis]ASU32347.1 hypothetical protein MuYL_0444 [Mucilaginibacter xinganensis]
MKTRFLFPHWSRYAGWCLIFLHIPVMVVMKIYAGNNFKGYNQGMDVPELFTPDHLFFIATALLMAAGLFLVAFSKEKIEDEQISQLRLDSLQWAIYLNYLVLFTTLVLTNDKGHILYLNLWIPLVFFIVRFRWMIFRLNRSIKEGTK